MSTEPQFVEVTCRGLTVAQKARFQPQDGGGFVEVEAPLPVGTPVGLSVEGGAAREAAVVGVVEQEASAKSAPGMRLRWKEAPAAATAPDPAAPDAEVEPESEGSSAVSSPGEGDNGAKKGRRSRKRR